VEGGALRQYRRGPELGVEPTSVLTDYLLADSLTNLLAHSLLTHPRTHALTHSRTHALTHSPQAKSWEARNTRRTFAEHRRYYTNELWKASYTGERAVADLRYIGQHIDHGVMARFGYKLLRKCVAVPAYGSTARRAVCKEEAPGHEHFPRYPSTDTPPPSDAWKQRLAGSGLTP
jgi:hypothetical protein